MDLIVYALLKSKLSEATSEISSRMNILEEDINNKMAVLDAGLTPVASKDGDVTKDAMTAEAWERLNDESVDIFASVDGVLIKATYEKNQDDEIVISAGNNILCTISEEGNRFTVDWNSYFTDADVSVVEKGLLSVELNLVNGEGAGSLKQVGATAASGVCAVAEGNTTTASGSSSHAEGSSTIASGISAHAEGQQTTASGANSHAEGSGTIASGSNSHAEGGSVSAAGNNSHAEGGNTHTYGIHSHAEGIDTITGNSNSVNHITIGFAAHAEGAGSVASGSASHAEGAASTASGSHSHAEGSGSVASGDTTHAEGNGSTASGSFSHAEGSGTYSYGINSHAEGAGSITGSSSNSNLGSCAHAEGSDTVASGNASHSEGGGTKANGNASHAEGGATIANGANSHSEGGGAEANGANSHAEGGGTYAYGTNSHAEGAGSITGSSSNATLGNSAHAEGSSSTATGNASHAEGNGSTASGVGSHAEGDSTASGNLSHSEGAGTVASANYSHAEGANSVASGNTSHAEGMSNAVGQFSHSEGNGTYAYGESSHAEGSGTTTGSSTVASFGSYAHAEGVSSTATGTASHAEGASTTASGEYSHAEGSSTTSTGTGSHSEGGGSSANGNFSHAEGSSTTANRRSQHVFGEYNITDNTGANGTVRGTYVEIVGNGTGTNARSNARALGWNGNEYLAGDVYVNCDASSANGTKLVSKTDYATELNAGVVKIANGGGIAIDSGGAIKTAPATDGYVKGGTEGNRPIVPSNQHAAAFYGLAKAAGDTTQASSSNAVGTYTNGAKTAIRNMIGAVGNTDYGNMLDAGIVKASGAYGIRIASADGDLSTFGADLTKIKVGTNAYEPIVPSHQHESAFYGLAKAAGDTTQASSSNAVGTYTDSAKTAIKNMLGVATASDKATYSIVNDAATNIQINGTSATLSDIISKNVGTIEVTQDGSTYIFELVESGTNKVYVCNYANSHAAIIPVANDATSLVPTWYDKYERIYVRYDEGTGAATVLNDSVATVLLNANIPTIVILTFAGDTSEKEYTLQRTEYQPNYGTGIKMVKYSNVDTANTSNETVVTICYSDGAIISVGYSVTQGLSDVTVNGTSVVSNGIANIPTAAHNVSGVVRIAADYGIGLSDSNTGLIYLSKASSSIIKEGIHSYKAIVPYNQHESTFYGLAKAAGDTTQAQSNNAVGTYTPEAKVAIQSMIGIPEAIGGSIIEISESNPIITAVSNTQYICGEVATLSFTPSQRGICDVIFTSGNTPTVLTLPDTVKMPEWFIIEENRIYEINILNGVYGSVMSWEQ